MQRCVWLVLVACLALVGCGSEKRLEVHPVSGTVLFSGKPAVDAEVTLHAAQPLKDDKERLLYPTARVESDGTYRITTYQPHDGAPEGEYKVTLTWPKVTVEAGESIYGPDQLNGRFATIASPVATVHIKAGENVVPPINLR